MAWVPKNVGRFRLFSRKISGRVDLPTFHFRLRIGSDRGPLKRYGWIQCGRSSTSPSGVPRATSVSLWYHGFGPFTRKIANMTNSFTRSWLPAKAPSVTSAMGRQLTFFAVKLRSFRLFLKTNKRRMQMAINSRLKKKVFGKVPQIPIESSGSLLPARRAPF